MRNWQQRVVEEKAELDVKIKKLSKFLKGIEDETLPDVVLDSVDGVGLDLLTDQYSAMLEYSECLEYRINRFNK